MCRSSRLNKNQTYGISDCWDLRDQGSLAIQLTQRVIPEVTLIFWVQELQNDLKVVMDEISQVLEKLHGIARENGEVKSGKSETHEQTKTQQQQYTPFAIVDEVADNSPASEAGVLVGDELCVFGSVTSTSSNQLPLIAQELQENENKVVKTVFLRKGEIIQMNVTPRKWSGRGLFGCHIVPK
eukprot:TRINITY_DN6738_c0_g1_i3.p1 TRINITY_DN6738_c0_g1~~TRINITY_DN6738_c0_g1_i3.p1  ORF type:complete len:183 (-),score=16.56 TRINITY_DN6738_c0_g1_i3:304-852(-)